MKKAKIIRKLSKACGSYRLCRCFFEYEIPYRYFYILDCSEKLFLGVEEDDFQLDGFHIRRISDIRKTQFKDDLCTKINRKNRLLKDVDTPYIDLSSWKSVFKSLEKKQAACYHRK